MGLCFTTAKPETITMAKFFVTLLIAFFAAAPPAIARSATPATSATRVAPVAHSHSLTEAEKIQALIGTVEKSQGLQFIRNGSAHDPAAAASHLRLKWKNAGKRVRTAEDFIRYCATGSSMSGKPYQIRYPSGRVENSADYFRAQLHQLELPGSKARTDAMQAASVKR